MMEIGETESVFDATWNDADVQVCGQVCHLYEKKGQNVDL